MQLVKIQPEQAAEKLADSLTAALKKYQTVTWLVPGGSNIPITVAAMTRIPDELTEKLIITQTDERYGPLDHENSNWRQLREAGMDFKKAKPLPILTEGALPLAETAARFAKEIRALEGLTYKIGQFGIGSNSHIAGIMPDSPAAVAEGLTVGYQADDFERISLTFSAIRQLNEAHAFVFGESKRAVLIELNDERHQPMIQPDQILKSLDKSYVYNDQIG